MDNEHCPECGRRWVHIRDGVYGCLWMAGHHNRQIIYRIGQEPPKSDVLLHVDVSEKRRRAKNNLKPKQKRRLMMEIAARVGHWYCTYCGKQLTPITNINIPVAHNSNSPTLDHIVPLSRGGSSELHNLCLSCKSCNNDKGDSILGGENARV